MCLKANKKSNYEYLIVGLGNPGPTHVFNRHNAGFLAIDKLSKENDIELDQRLANSIWGTGLLSGHQCILLKPLTFMNNSGDAVLQALKIFKLSQNQLIVICDDISLPVGQLRIKENGSSGGQKGLNDIIEKLDSQEVKRIRIGAGYKPDNYDLKSWVLSDFSKAELENLQNVFCKTCQAVNLIVQKNINKAMSQYNRRVTGSEKEEHC